MRKNSFGVPVERVFPLHSPKIAGIEVVSRGDVRRAKLYYIREKVGKKARVKKATRTKEVYQRPARQEGAASRAAPSTRSTSLGSRSEADPWRG